jgi:protein CpxP
MSNLDEFFRTIIWARNPRTRFSLIAKERMMPLTSEQRDMVESELKRFATDLNLSEEQKEKLRTSLSEAHQKVQEYKQQNTNVLKEDLIRKVAENRSAIRQRVVSFLTPEQLTKWDAEIAKAKEFLGQKIAA